MSCANYDFSVCRGSTFSRELVYKDNLGDPIDLTGWAAAWTVGTGTYTSPSTNVTVGGVDGTITLVLTSAQVDALGPRTSYRLVISNPSLSSGLGDIAILEGKIEVE